MPPLHCHTAQITLPVSELHTRLVNLSFRPDNLPTSHNVAPCLFSKNGFDVVPSLPPRVMALLLITMLPLLAVGQCRCEAIVQKEKGKLKRQGVAADDSSYYSCHLC
jgi:hypothetical protein